MVSPSDRLLPSGMLWLWVSNQMEGPGTRDAPREVGIAVCSATGREEKTRIPRPRQVIDGSPDTAGFISTA